MGSTSYHVRMPWTKIHEYLLEVGSATDIDDFCHKALVNIDRLIPYDANGIFATIDRYGVSTARFSVYDCGQIIKQYNEHYSALDPVVKMTGERELNWSTYRNTEYYEDFIHPQGIWRTTGFIMLDQNGECPSGIVLHRSKLAQPFSIKELAILDILCRHLSNMYVLFCKAAENNKPGLIEGNAFTDNKMLTKKEAEIAALLCQGKSTEQIAVELFISRQTVYKHVEHIFQKLQVKNRLQLVIKSTST